MKASHFYSFSLQVNVSCQKQSESLLHILNPPETYSSYSFAIPRIFSCNSPGSCLSMHTDNQRLVAASLPTISYLLINHFSLVSYLLKTFIKLQTLLQFIKTQKCTDINSNLSYIGLACHISSAPCLPLRFSHKQFIKAATNFYQFLFNFPFCGRTHGTK